jgi:arylsulfatase A-like enzyme
MLHLTSIAGPISNPEETCPMAQPPTRGPVLGRHPGQPQPEPEVTINNPIANVPGQPQQPEPPQAAGSDPGAAAGQQPHDPAAAPGQPLPTPPAGGRVPVQPGQGLPPVAGAAPGQGLPPAQPGAPGQALPTPPVAGQQPGAAPGQGLPPVAEGAPEQLPSYDEGIEQLPAWPTGPEAGDPGRGTTHPGTSHPHLALHLLNRKRKERRAKKPNILVIFSDDVGRDNVSIYNRGISGYYTHNIDRIGKEGALFTHSYGQNSCTAGRSAFVMGQCPFRTGMCAVGLPGSPDGIPDWTPTIADCLKDQGYRTAQIGKNHLGDWNHHLPTMHGFDYFYGNLYHLNTSEEPFQLEYPKEPEFFAKYGPRGVLECHALDHSPPDVREDPRFGPQGNQRIKDTGQMPIERMVHFDDSELLPRMKNFMKEAAKADEPFFLWACTSRMHVWTHLDHKSEGVTDAGLFGDGMAEHDKLVGELLKCLDDLKIADDTIVVWTTDNGAEKASWPDGGSTAFHGEKGTTNEGAFRVPLVMRWPGVIDPGTEFHEIFSFEDFLPTLVDAAGNPDIVEQMKEGAVRKHGRAARQENRGDTWGKVHLDGFSFVPYWLGEVDKSPRETFVYFGQNGKLDAVRWRQYKGAFATPEGDIFQGTRSITNAPILTDLYEDPFQVMSKEGQKYMEWYGERLWVFAPLGQVVADFMESLHGYQNEFRSSMGAQDLSYDTAKVAEVMQAIGKRHVMFMDPFG